MKYVKLTAKPDTWFKEGTEAYDYNCHAPKELVRLTLTEWEECNDFAVMVRGIRISKFETELKIFGEGERWDGEYCQCSEFVVEIVDEPC